LAQEADVSGPAQLEQQKRELDALTASFKQISAIVLPLGKQAVLFDLYKSNVARWRSTVEGQYSAILRKLIVRAALFALIVAIVLGLSEIWRRATFRYVHDLRRRYQFLLLRRIVLWFVIGITIAFALATEIGSLATFAGLITAGIAVALQNVILAVAGYFFLIGKYGVKVGDRVQISGVAGDVVDIGLIRLHLMEIAGTGADRQPTGRVVVFSNSIVFQPGASFYRQIPGTNFLWHQLTLTLSPEADYAAAEKRLREAIERVYERYKEKIEQQHRQMEQTLNMPIAMPRIRTHVIPRDNGLEVTIRYPVDAEHAADIDDQVTRELLAALKQAPEFKLAGLGVPSIKAVEEESKAA
jgi:small-conductance mechanosensitive channel